MLFEKIKSDILAHNSYIIGAGGEAAVIDPRRDCLVYATVAEREGMKITKIFETHKNEDYVIGSRELARPTGAEILHGAREEFGFGTGVREGETFTVGSLELEVLETPGHTIESISLLLRDRSVSGDPLMVFTGDALFAWDVGRTDLAGEDKRREMSEMLYASLHEKLLTLPDSTIVCPAHGAGSVCGGNIGDREYTTIGFEKATNGLLSLSKEEFVERKVSERLYEPQYIAMMRKLNREGPPLIYNLPHLQAYSAREIRSLMDRGVQVVDIRSPTSFAGGHIPGTISIWRQGLPLYMGYYLNYEDPIVLVDDFNLDLDHVVRHFVRLGYDNIAGYLAGGLRPGSSRARSSSAPAPGLLPTSLRTWTTRRSGCSTSGTSTTGRGMATSRGRIISTSGISRSISRRSRRISGSSSTATPGTRGALRRASSRSTGLETS